MAGKRKLTIRTSKKPAITIGRGAHQHSKLAYIATANKLVKYRWGRSAIVYIGTTEKGGDRIAASAAFQAQSLLKIFGVKALRFYVVTCKSKQKVKSWRLLEDALLLTFRAQYGELPKGNKKRGGKKALDYFREARLRKVLAQYRDP